VFSKIECQLYSRTALNVLVTFGDQKAADNLVGVCDVQLMNVGQNKFTRIKNLRLDFCQLKKHTDTRSLLGAYYQAIRRAVVNFPDKCPFQKVSVISFSDLRYFLIILLLFRTPHILLIVLISSGKTYRNIYLRLITLLMERFMQTIS